MGAGAFTTAPGWLARENYETDWPAWSPSRCPEIWCSEISPEWALEEIRYDSLTRDYYANMELRVTLFSKAYAWYEKFSAAHPENTEVYYEDEDFVCYMIRQDPAAPLDLPADVAG